MQRNSQSEIEWKISMKESCDQNAEKFTKQDKVKDINERTMWSRCREIHKSRQSERSQWKNHVIRMQRNSQSKTEWKISIKEPCDQDAEKFTSKTDWKITKRTMGSGHHKITKWNHGIRISQYYRLEPWDQDITKLQSGTMGSGYHKVTDWNHGIRDHEIKNWNHMISISQNYRQVFKT